MKQLLTLQELAEETGMPIGTLYELCAPKGDLPCVRTAIGPGAKRKTRSRIRVQRSDWDAWVERHRSVPPASTAAPPAIERAVARKSVADLPGASRYAS